MSNWDIYCRVIDNYGDAGVCYRLASQLAARGQRVRLFIDDPRPLSWMRTPETGHVQVLAFPQEGVDALATVQQPALEPATYVVSGFGCDVPASVLHAMVQGQAQGRTHRWIYLEYLSAEPYVERSHGLGSYVSEGPGRGLRRDFFFPGFTPGSGGLLREDGLALAQSRFDRSAWLASQGVVWQGEPVYSLFCYEPEALSEWLQKISQRTGHLLVTNGRAAAAVRACLPNIFCSTGALHIHYLPWLDQTHFDYLLWSSDLNLVRGEDSLVRALWAGKAMVWQAYPQSQNAERDKLEAFLDFYQASDDLRQFYAVWNGASQARLPPLNLAAWTQQTQAARARLWAQSDLVTRLLCFVSENR